MSEDIAQVINAEYIGDKVLASNSNASNEFYDKTRYGEPYHKKFQYSLVEALYLLEREKMQITKGKKLLDFDSLLRIAVKKEANFFIRYSAFKDMRNRGYVVKTALKFGADFRVYDRGIKPGDDHAKWIMFPVAESSTMTWYDFSSKNRVAHSTRKRLLIAVVDEEGDVTYYEIKWTRP
ncbi:tRNA-intron lyase [Candidatus Woesearchaeota archaeon]|nr:tRNA-intron lyase [Candidatus Woesearchaeota archaeon]